MARISPEEAKDYGWRIELAEAQRKALDAMQQLGWSHKDMLNLLNFNDEAHIYRALRNHGYVHAEPTPPPEVPTL